MAWASSAPPASSSSAFWRSGGRARPRPPQHRHWPGQPREPAARPGRALRRRDHHQRALAIHEAQLSPDHPATAYSLNNLGTVLYGLGELSAARTTLERALAIREAQFGPDHPDTVMVRENLASVLVGSVRASSLPGSESQRHDPALVAHLAPTPPATAAWSPAPGSEVVGGQTSACSRVWAIATSTSTSPRTTPAALARQVGTTTTTTTTTTTVARQWLYTLRARHQADRIAYHRSYLSQVERGRQVPTEQFAI